MIKYQAVYIITEVVISAVLLIDFLLDCDLKVEMTRLFGSDDVAPVGGPAHTGGLGVLDGTTPLSVNRTHKSDIPMERGKYK